MRPGQLRGVIICELPPKRHADPMRENALNFADVDIIRYDPKKLSQPPYRLLVHSISPVFAKQVRHRVLVPAQAFRLRQSAWRRWCCKFSRDYA